MSADRPLAGRTVVVTRPEAQAASLAGPLEELGATVVLCPTIRIVPRAVDDEIVRVVVNDLADYGLVVFTSANGVDVFLGYFSELGLRPAELAHATVAAVGPQTARALEDRGVACAVVAGDFIAEGLVDTLRAAGLAPAGARVLIPSARLARPLLADALRAEGALVDVLPVYDTARTERLAVPAAAIEAADFVTFTSGSTAREFAALLEEDGAGRPLDERLAGARLCSIGPQTSEALRALGLPVALEAAEHTAAGLATAVAAAASPGG